MSEKKGQAQKFMASSQFQVGYKTSKIKGAE